MGLGLKGKIRRTATEFRIRFKNAFRKPRLYQSSTPERLGAIYCEPTDMCTADRVMLYALVRGLRPERVLEIGVRWGGGARIIAAALEDAAGAGRAIGIDPVTKAFRCGQRELFGRYELFQGYSPEAISQAVAQLGGTIDLAIIDAMHTYDHVLADFQGVIPHLAPGAHVLLHDAFHVGIDNAVGKVLKDHAEFVDCGFVTRHAEVGDCPVGYQGLRLIRAKTLPSQELISRAYARDGYPPPAFTPDLWNWDSHYNRIR
jgi:predicted O-methyltransferase YrrM